jgi:signal transduction histidine kinase
LRKAPEIHESLTNIRSVLRVLQVRLREYRLRQQLDSDWVAHSARELRENLENFLMAVEKNARGRYQIVFNIARQADRDYVVHIQLDTALDGFIHGPAALGDVLRDLSANARKYTMPGGKLDIGINDDGHRTRMVVEDTGLGIPAQDMERVVEFGCRGRNVIDLPTKGGGFGLTKAYVLVRKFGGRMWINSQENKGTRITIEIPYPHGA